MADDSRVMFIFPGQGSQYRGMGSDLCRDHQVAREVYGQANEVLGYDMERLSFEDPDDHLGLTRFTQPALLTHQVACLRVFQSLCDDSINPYAAAGHSLGEYTALVVAGALSFEDGLRLVRVRGELMSEHGEGGMLALGLDLETARPLADKYYCGVGGCNLPKQTVIGGIDDDLDALEAEIKKIFPRQRPVRLKTEGAFHTYCMVAAARLFRPVLEATAIAEPGIKVLSNYSGDYHEQDPAAIKSRLFFQLFNPVKWIGCIRTALESEVSVFIEFGGGIGTGEGPEHKRPNLKSIIKKTLRIYEQDAVYYPAINSGSIAESVAALGC